MASNFWTALGFTPNGFSMVKGYADDYNGNARLGDLFMVKFCSSGGGSGLQLYHAGVCCSEEEQDIIHFRPLSSGKSSGSSSSSCSGEISKSSVEVFCGGTKFAIFRKDTGIPGSFKADVRAAMKKTPEYNLWTYNCIHFALELLHVDSETTEDYIKKFIKFLDAKGTDMEMRPFRETV